MLIEADYRDKEVTLAHNGLGFSVPKRLHMIGMMNTADRSLDMIDHALRRRSRFFDIHLQKDNTVLIIDAKYYSHTTQIQYNKHTLYSDNLYQIFAYVKNRDHGFGEEEHQVSGMLLYAKTEENIQTDNVYQLHGNQITVKTLDLNQKFDIIAEQLNEIARDHFDVQG